MKILSLIFVAFFCSFFVNAQNNNTVNEKLKTENERLKNQIKNLSQDTSYLKEKIKICNQLMDSKAVLVKNNNPLYTFDFLECTGNRDLQTITITFMISQKDVNQSFYFNDPYNSIKAIDNLGVVHELKQSTFIVIKDVWADLITIPTNTRIKGSFIFRNVLPSTEQINSMLFQFFSKNLDSNELFNPDKKYTVEFQNMPIKWNK